MNQDLLDSIEVAQPLARVLLEQSPQQALDFIGEGGVAREGELLMEDAAVDLLVVEAVVGRDSEDQFVEEGSQAVVVQGETVTSSKSAHYYFSSISGAMYSGLPQNE